MEWNWSDFRFLSGRKWITRLRFYTNFTPAFYGYLQQQYHQMMVPRPARFLFPVDATSGSCLVANPVLSEWISARTVTLDRFSRDCERRVIPVDLDCATTSGRAISASGGSKGWRPDADTTVDLLVGATNPGFFHVESAYFTENIPNYTEYWKITPNLITD